MKTCLRICGAAALAWACAAAPAAAQTEIDIWPAPRPEEPDLPPGPSLEPAQGGSLAAPGEQDGQLIAPAPQWREGAEWEYSDGYGLRVSSSGGVLTVFERTDAPGQWFSRIGFLRQNSVSPTSLRQTIYRTISPYDGMELRQEDPLTYRREYLRDGELLVHATSWTLEGRERITVPAGTFDCWIIVWRSRSLGSNWTGFERWWYAPAAQNYVRMEYKYGDMPTASRVLMEYRLPSPEMLEEAEQAALDDADRAMARGEGQTGLLWSAELVPEPVDVYPLAPVDEGEGVRFSAIN